MSFRSVVLLAFAVFVFGSFLAVAIAAEPIAPDKLQPSAPSKPPLTGLEDAAAAFRDGDHKGALRLLREAVQKNPDLPPARAIMAELFFQTNQGLAARGMLEDAVVENPADPEPYLILGRFAMGDGRITEADLLYSKAASLVAGLTGSAKRKKNVQIRADDGLAGVAKFRGKWPAAQKYLEDWLKLDPQNAIAMQRLAWALFKQKKMKESLEELKKAAVADPTILFPGARFALFYHKSGDEAAAKTWMEYAVKKAPNNLRVQMVGAEWALETNQFALAERLADAALKIEPASPRVKLLRGVVASFQKDYKTAEAYFQKAHIDAPGDFLASNNLALALIEQEDPAKKTKAMQYAESNARRFPNLPDAAATYLWALYKVGRIDDAEKVTQHLASRGNFGPDAAYYMARVLVDKNQKERAKRLLESALASKGLFAKRKEAQDLLSKLGQ